VRRRKRRSSRRGRRIFVVSRTSATLTNCSNNFLKRAEDGKGGIETSCS
jgi:hypothetical protein